MFNSICFFFSSRRRHTRWPRDWSSDVCSSDLASFLMDVMNYEQKRREEKKIERHLKWATFPYHKTLEQFNLSEQKSLSNKQFNQLKELLWIEQIYNLILLGPPGVGKTHLAIGLGIKAINRGYKDIFITMGERIDTV